MNARPLQLVVELRRGDVDAVEVAAAVEVDSQRHHGDGVLSNQLGEQVGRRVGADADSLHRRRRQPISSLRLASTSSVTSPSDLRATSSRRAEKAAAAAVIRPVRRLRPRRASAEPSPSAATVWALVRGAVPPSRTMRAASPPWRPAARRRESQKPMPRARSLLDPAREARAGEASSGIAETRSNAAASEAAKPPPEVTASAEGAKRIRERPPWVGAPSWT